jgi:glycosyltransferase involved in cell wall biosynthesis
MPFPKFLAGFSDLRGSLLQRYCKRVSREFDLMISSYNFIDFGKKSIQFIADFSFDQDLRNRFVLSSIAYYKKGFLKKIYSNICNLIAKKDLTVFNKDIIISNSAWTANHLRKKYGFDSTIIYPPVASGFKRNSYKNRKNAFVCIGRIVPEKRIDVIIDILKDVRKEAKDIELYIAGQVDKSPYCEGLNSICKNNEWIHVLGRLNEARKKEIIFQNKFGINACVGESFGIAVAEMARGGCITFVPKDGGQVEVVANEALEYKDREDAVKKIKMVLKDEELQGELQQNLLLNSHKFSIEYFQQQVNSLVDEFFNEARK